MSNLNNSELLERANEMVETFTNHPSGYDRALARAIEDNDLENVRYLTTIMEAELSQREFEANDAY